MLLVVCWSSFFACAATERAKMGNKQATQGQGQDKTNTTENTTSSSRDRKSIIQSTEENGKSETIGVKEEEEEISERKL
jgi:hypothetical protein